jgi:hypothetical protein
MCSLIFEGPLLNDDMSFGSSISSSGTRSAPELSDFGIPLDINEIQSEASSQEVTRSLIRNMFDPFIHDQNHNLMRTSLKNTTTPSVLPDYLEPSDTSFQTKKSLQSIQSEIKQLFIENDIMFRNQQIISCGYDCSALYQACFLEFEINFFIVENEQGLFVEFRNMKGCQHSFLKFYNYIATMLQVDFVPAKYLTMVPPSSHPLTSQDETHTRDFLIQLLTAPSRSSLLQGLQILYNVLEHPEDFVVNVMNLFSGDNDWLPVAEKVLELAMDDDDEVSTVAMSVVAKIATLEHIYEEWVYKSIPVLVVASNDDLPHKRREATRAIHTIISRDDHLKVYFVGVVDLTEAPQCINNAHQDKEAQPS